MHQVLKGILHVSVGVLRGDSDGHLILSEVLNNANQVLRNNNPSGLVIQVPKQILVTVIMGWEI